MLINLAPVVQRVDKAIQRISIGKTNYAIRWIVLSTLWTTGAWSIRLEHTSNNKPVWQESGDTVVIMITPSQKPNTENQNLDLAQARAWNQSWEKQNCDSHFLNKSTSYGLPAVIFSFCVFARLWRYDTNPQFCMYTLVWHGRYKYKHKKLKLRSNFISFCSYL